MKEEHLKTFSDIKKLIIDNHKGDFLYRGVPNSKFELDSTLLRMYQGQFDRENLHVDALLKLEAQINNSFLASSIDAFPANILPLCQNYIDYISLARHYGLYTRLIDFTANPLIALFFACTNEDYKNEDAGLFVLSSEDKLNFMVNNTISFHGDNKNNTIFETENYFTFESSDELKVFKVHDTFIYKPCSKLDERIFNQDAYIIVQSNPSLSLDKNLASKQSITKYIISKEIKEELITFLESVNLSYGRILGLPEIVNLINSNYKKTVDASDSEKILKEKLEEKTGPNAMAGLITGGLLGLLIPGGFVTTALAAALGAAWGNAVDDEKDQEDVSEEQD